MPSTCRRGAEKWQRDESEPQRVEASRRHVKEKVDLYLFFFFFFFF
jgi:hypothetical protein